ncbi:MAG: S1 RNA-binding domain-containing protein [Clostridia bacterium]|nr:S1 RNA-binding domain-containing protein [Clostridia bacterium]
MTNYYPEGQWIHTPRNRAALATAATLREAMAQGTVLESRVLRCDAAHNLYVELPCGEGIIPYFEGALGIAEGTTRDIALISRVSRPVCFTVQAVEEENGRVRALLSRRAAQERCRREYLDTLVCGDIIPARVTRLESFGAFCDVGCGLPALMPIAGISVSRIPHPADRFSVGDKVWGVVSSRDNGRLCLSMRELLGTWEQNVALFTPGATVAGVVRSVESYGIFVELTPNLAGLAEWREGVRPGARCGVYIKSLLPARMKLKLVIVDAGDPTPAPPPPLRYFLTEGHIDRWVYSPAGCEKQIQSVFVP